MSYVIPRCSLVHACFWRHPGFSLILRITSQNVQNEDTNMIALVTPNPSLFMKFLTQSLVSPSIIVVCHLFVSLLPYVLLPSIKFYYFFILPSICSFKLWFYFILFLFCCLFFLHFSINNFYFFLRSQCYTLFLSRQKVSHL